MPNYTTSYSKHKSMNLARSGKRPRSGKKGDLGQLPGARQRSRRKRGANYLKHSQSFGASNVRRRRRLSPRAGMALIFAACAFFVFLASIIWYINRDVKITLNGSTVSVRINSSITTVISDQGLDQTLKSGDLLAVDDSVLTEGGGEAYNVKLNGKRVNASRLSKIKIEGGEKLVIKSGRDRYEAYDVQATTTDPTISVDGSGSIQFVKTWGVPGRSEVWTGKQSGITHDRGTVREVVNCVVAAQSVSPDRGQKVVALTFDEAPSSVTQKLLSVLKKKGAGATFFLSGEACAGNQVAAKAIVDAGFEIGSNSQTEQDLSKLDGDDLRTQLAQGFSSIREATGTATTLLRAPGGKFSEKNWAQAADMVGAVVSWDLNSGDVQMEGASAIAQTVVDSVSPGDIIYMTDSDSTASQTVKAAGAVVDALQNAGYKVVSVSDLIKTDKELAAEMPSSFASIKMPSGAVLPQYQSDSSADSASASTSG